MHRGAHTPLLQLWGKKRINRGKKNRPERGVRVRPSGEAGGRGSGKSRLKKVLRGFGFPNPHPRGDVDRRKSYVSVEKAKRNKKGLNWPPTIATGSVKGPPDESQGGGRKTGDT